MEPVPFSDMRDRVTVQRRTVSQDGYGAPSLEWSDVATVWAKVEPLDGSEQHQGGRVRADATHRITIRYYAGLTTKHIDAPGLVRCLEEGTSRAARVEPLVFNYSTDVFSPCGDFALSVTQSSPADPAGVVLPGSGARLLVCTGGEVALANRRDEVLRMGRGDVAYADDSDGELRVAGTGEIAQAFVPAADARGQLFDLL